MNPYSQRGLVPYRSSDNRGVPDRSSMVLIPNTEKIQQKKKVVSDLLALRRMKLKQQGGQGSPFSSFEKLPVINPEISAIDLEPVLEDTLLKEELLKLHGKDAFDKAARHFQVLSENAKLPTAEDDADIKRSKFINNILQKRRIKLEKDRQQRIRKQESLMNQQVQLTQKELTLLASNTDLSSKHTFDFDLPEMIEDTGKNLKAMERNLRLLKLRYARDLAAAFRDRIAKEDMETLRVEHPEEIEMAEWIIEMVLKNVNDHINKSVGNLYESQLLEILLLSDKEQYENLQQKMAMQDAILELVNDVIGQAILAMIYEVCEECFLLALMSVVYPEDLVVESGSKSVVAKATKSKGKLSSNTKVVNDSFSGIKHSRERFKNGLWSHSQAIIKELAPTISDVSVVTPKVVPEVSVPVVESQGDFVPISSEGSKPKLDSRFGNSWVMATYAEYENALWKSYSLAVPDFGFPPRRTIGICVACLSSDHAQLSVGSFKGDVLVYDLMSNFTLTRSAVYRGKVDDSIVSIQWSIDNTRLVSMSRSGCIIMWSVTFAPYTSTSDISLLNLPQSSYSNQQLTALCVLESAKGDFQLKNNALGSNSKGNFHPTAVHFHPTLSTTATQDCIVVALKNGDILKCNLFDNIQARFTNQLLTELQGSSGANSVVCGSLPIETSKTLKIEQDINVEVFRYHRTDISQLCFVKNSGDMISLDLNLYICQWKHNSEQLNSFGWFVPFKKFQLSFIEEILESKDDDDVIFEDTTLLKKGKIKKKSKKVIEQERRRALREIQDLGIARQRPWYTDEFPDRLESDTNKRKNKKPLKFITRIYAPSEDSMADTAAGGARFIVLTLKKDVGLLVKLAYRTYVSINNVALSLLDWKVSPSADRMYFMNLFDEHLPRTRKHISFIDLDLATMELGKIGAVQIEISSRSFDRCVEGGAAFFSVSRVDLCAGTEYILSNVNGEISVHSLLSGRPVSQIADDERPNQAGGLQLPPRVRKLKKVTRVQFVKPDGNTSYFLFLPVASDRSYAAAKVFQITDNSVPPLRKALQGSYKTLSAWKRTNATSDLVEVGWFASEQAAQKDNWTHRHMPLKLYMELILNTMIDVVVARSTNIRMPQEMRKKVWKQDWKRMESYFSSVESF